MATTIPYQTLHEGFLVGSDTNYTAVGWQPTGMTLLYGDVYSFTLSRP